MKQDNGILDRTGWFARMQWTKIWLCAFAIAAIAIGSGWNQSALAVEVRALTAGELKNALKANVEPSDWFDPPVIKKCPDGRKTCDSKELNVTLTTMMVTNWIADQQITHPSYNGGLVGPTLEFEAGDILNVTLINNLPDNTSEDCPDPPPNDQPHCKYNTNLHTHGLHISPKDNSDNVLLTIEPNQEYEFNFDIRDDHYPGTFWYHAHHHGSTAYQLKGGMAGALILKGDIDEWDGVKGARERIFVFQELQGESGTTFKTTINGKRVPLIEMRPGEVERWRFIHGGVSETLDIWLQDAEFHLIALDGITLKEVRQVNEIFMAPGYRADVMVKAPDTSGDYYLYKNGAGSEILGPEGFTEDIPSPDEILAVVRVDGTCDDCHNTLPTTLPDRNNQLLQDITEIDNDGDPRKMEFASNSTINGNKFDSNRVDFCLKKGDAEEWELTNTTGGDHPFHIHVNAFEVIDPGNSGAVAGDWHDTIFVKKDDTVKIRTRYENFDGKFVLHCHILSHEDKGMMSLVEINDDGTSCN